MFVNNAEPPKPNKEATCRHENSILGREELDIVQSARHDEEPATNEANSPGRQ